MRGREVYFQRDTALDSNKNQFILSIRPGSIPRAHKSKYCNVHHITRAVCIMHFLLLLLHIRRLRPAFKAFTVKFSKAQSFFKPHIHKS